MTDYYLSTRFGESIKHPSFSEVIGRFSELDIEASEDLAIELSLEDHEGLGCSLAFTSVGSINVSDDISGCTGTILNVSRAQLLGYVEDFLTQGREFLLSIDISSSDNS